MMIAIVLGLIVGVILALSGAGGGILAVPLLVFGLHMSVAQAGPIGLLAVAIAAALGALLGLRAGLVRYRAALMVSACGMLLAPLGLWLAQRTAQRALGVLFALVLLVVAWRSYRQARAPAPASVQRGAQPCLRSGADGRFIWTSACAFALGLSGSVAGVLSGLLGVGGGFVMVPALRRYTDLDMKSAVATSLAVIALVSISGVLASAASGGLAWKVAVPFAAGALAGMLGGRLVAARLAGPQLQTGFAAVTALVAIGMLVKSVL